MNKDKMKLKRSAILSLVFALVWMFLIPVQAFADDVVSGDPGLVLTETGGGDENSAGAEESSGGSEDAVPAGSAYLAPSIDTPPAQTADQNAETQTETPTGGDQTNDPPAGDGQTDDPPAGDDQTNDPPVDGGQTDDPPAGDGQTDDPPAGDDQTNDPPAGGGQTNDPPVDGGQTPQPLQGEGEPAPPVVTSGGADVDTSGDWTRFENTEGSNAIQQAVDAAIAAGQKYITVVVQDGTYAGGLIIDNSGVDENGNAKDSIVVNIVAHDAYAHSETDEPVGSGNGVNSQADENNASGGNDDSADSAPGAVYPVPANPDGTVDASAIGTGSSGGVKLEGGVSVKNVELLLAGIYLTLKEQQTNQEAVESATATAGEEETSEPADTDPGNVDIKVESANNFTYYGTSKDDTVNITLTDVKNAAIDSGDGDDVLDINTTMSPNVELDITKGDAELKQSFSQGNTSDSSISVSTGAGNDKITVTETSTVTNNADVVSVRKGENKITVDAGDGADTITLKGDSKLVDIAKNINDTIAQKVYAIVSVAVEGHGSEAEIIGGAGDDLLNLDTTFELGTLGQTAVDYQGGDGKNRLHFTGTLAPVDTPVSVSLENGITMHGKNTVSRTDYSLVETDLWFNKTVTELVLQSSNPLLQVQMNGVDSLTDDLSGKQTVKVIIDNGVVKAKNANGTWEAVSFEAFTDYVYEPEADTVTLGSFSNESRKNNPGLLTKLIIRGRNLIIEENTTDTNPLGIYLPGVTLMLESLNGSHESGSILIAGKVEAENIMLKLVSTDTFDVSFVNKDETDAGVNPSIMDVNTSSKVNIASTAQLIASSVVDIMAKTIQRNGLLPDLSGLNTDEIDAYINLAFGFNGLEMLKQAASINFISIKMASAFVDILGSIVANSVRVSANSNVDTTATNSALRDIGLPFALSVILGEAGITVSGEKASITADGDIYLDATSDITVNTTALSGRLPFTVAVTVVDNEAFVDINGGTLRSTNGNIIANATGTVNMKTAATGSNIRPNGSTQTPSGDNSASNTTTQLDMGKSGGFFAISVLNQDVFSALRGAASAIAKGDITVNSTAKASVVNQAASNPGEDGESMTLVKLIQMLTRDEKVPGDGGIVGKVVNKITGYFSNKKDQTSSKEEKAEIQKQNDKKTSALGGFLNKLTGNGQKDDSVGSLVDQATTSANSGKKDSTKSVQLVGALAVTYADNNNTAYIDTTGTVTAGGKLSVLANGELKVDTLADGSPVKADDPAAGGDAEQTGPQDQHFDAHTHGMVKVDALTNGTILIGASVGKDENGIYEVQDNTPNFEIKDPTPFNFVVRACYGYKLQADKDGKYWITNEYKRDSDNTDQTEKIEVEFLGKDEQGRYIYRGNSVQLFNGQNLFKAEFVAKHSLAAETNDKQLGKVEFSDIQQGDRQMVYADHEEMVYVTVNVKSGASFATPVITYISDTYHLAQPFDALEMIDKDGKVIKDKTGDVQEDGTNNYYYRFKMPNGKVTMVVNFTGDEMNIKLDLEEPAQRVSDVWITAAGEEPSKEAMTKDDTFKGNVGDKIKIVIQLANDTFLAKNSLMFAGKTPVYIKDITYDGNNQYTCYVNIPAILKTEGAADAGSDLKLAFQTTTNSSEAQLTVQDTSTALGAGLAVDVTRYHNQAYISGNTAVTARSVEVKADTAELSASAVSKAGFVAGNLGVAGAITVHLVSANNEAYVGGNVNLTGGDLTMDSTIQKSNIITNAEAAGEGADGENTDRDSVGVGAGIAVGVTNLAVVSKILDSAVIGGTIGNLNVNAGHTGEESMTASAGASGGTSVVPVLAMNISGVSVVADSGTRSGVLNLSGDVLIKAINSITRNITADAAAVGAGVGVGGSFIIDILNDGARAKLGQSVKNNANGAKGNVTVSADSVSRLKATAKAGAKGSVSGEDGAGDTGGSGGDSGTSDGEGDSTSGSDNSGGDSGKSDEWPDDYYDGLDNLFNEEETATGDEDPESLAPLFKESEADAFVDSNKDSAKNLTNLVQNNKGNETRDGNENNSNADNNAINSTDVGNAFENRQKAESSEGSVQVAATMVLNVQKNVALAQIAQVDSIEAGGKVSVTSRHDTDGVIMANASATNSSTGVGVAVAINTVTYSNIAEILADRIVADEIVVQASVYEEEAEKTADSFLEAVKKDLFGEEGKEGKLKTFVTGLLGAANEGELNTFIIHTLKDLNIELSSEDEEKILPEIVSLICQWVEELLQGQNPSFPSEDQEEEVQGEEQTPDNAEQTGITKSQVAQYAKAVFIKVKEAFSNENLRKQLFGEDGILKTLKEEIKDLNLKEKVTGALVSYLAGKLGANEESEGVGPRISTSAVSGAGATNVGVAGSVAISVVNGTSKAYIKATSNTENENMSVAGNITVESRASQDVYTSAGASVDALGRVDKNKDDTDTANSTQGDASDKDVGKSVGVGAAVAMSFADLTSEAGIGSGWKITAKDLLTNSSAENNVETTSVSGTDPLARTEEPTDKKEEDESQDNQQNQEKKDKTEKNQEEQKAEKKAEEEKAAKAMDYAVDASVSVTLIQNAVKSYLAENSVINLTGNLNMLSAQSGETNTNASGYAMGNATAVGAAVAINLAFSDVLTEVLGSGTVAGSASLDSKTENQDDATAMALAMGAEMDRYFAKLRNAEKVMAFNKKKENQNTDENGDGKADGKIENETSNKISGQLKRASKVSEEESEDKNDASAASEKETKDKSDASQPLSVQALKSQNVKTESTNQTDSGKTDSIVGTVTDATDANTGNAVSGTLNQQTQEGQAIHVAASVGVNVTQHSAKTKISGNLTVGGLKAEVENTSNFSTASTGAAISEATNSNCVGAAVAVSVNGNQSQIEISDGVKIVVTGTPVAPSTGTGEKADSVLGNVALSTLLNQNSTGDGLGRYGALAVSGSSSGKGGKVGLAGSVAVMVAKGTSAIILGDNVSITGTTSTEGTVNPVAGSVSIAASDTSKLSAAAMAATKSDGSSAGVGASFALLYAQNEVLADAGDNFTVNADSFHMTATKHVVSIKDFDSALSAKEVISVIEVDSEGNGGYTTEKAGDYGMIVLQKNQDESYNFFPNLNSGNILDLIQMTSLLASVNYYASAVAGTVMESKGDTSGQKAAVAGAVSMLFNNSVTRVSIGNNASIKTSGATEIAASSKTNTRLLGGALSVSGAKAGIGLNVATAKQKDQVYATIGNAPVILAGSFRLASESISDMLVITAAAVSASSTAVGGSLNVVINDTRANSTVGSNANITASHNVTIESEVDSGVILGSLSATITKGTNKGASVGAVVNVTTNATNSQAVVGDDATIISNVGSITIWSINQELVLSVLAAAARSGDGGAVAGTLSVLTTDAKSIAGVGKNATLHAHHDINVFADSSAKLIDLMMAAALSTDAPAVGATIMVNVFNRETNAYIGNDSILSSKRGNVLVQASSDEGAIIVSIAGSAASQNAVSGNVQVNVGSSKTYATIGNNANIKAWDSIRVTANHNSGVVAISPSVSYASGSTGVVGTVQTTVIGSDVQAIIGDKANLIAYAQNSATGGVVHTANRENKRKGIILSALAKDSVVAGGVSASAGKNAIAGMVVTFINKTIAYAKMGASAVVQVGNGEDSALGSGSSETEGELTAEADAHSTLHIFGGALSASSSNGVGATVLTLVYNKDVDAQLNLSTDENKSSCVNGNVNVKANAGDTVKLISVNFGISGDTAVNAAGNILIFQDKINAKLTGHLTVSGDIAVSADSNTDLVNAIASVSGSLGTAVSGAALVTYYQGTTTASIGKASDITCRNLQVKATSIAVIGSHGVGLAVGATGTAVSGLVNVIVTSTTTKAYVDSNCNIHAADISVIATDKYDLLAVAASLSAGQNAAGVTAVVTVAKNTVQAYIGYGSTIICSNLTLQALSDRTIRNYAGTAAAGNAGIGATVMVAVIGGKLDQDSADGITEGFKSDLFMNDMKTTVPNVAKKYLNNVSLSADLQPDGSQASDLVVGDSEGRYNGADDYRSDDFEKQYNSGTNPGENISDDITNTQGSELGMAKPEGEYTNTIQAFIASNCQITVTGETLVEANEKLNVDIVTAAVAGGATAGFGVGVAVVVAYSNVEAEIRSGTELVCGNVTVHAVSGAGNKQAWIDDSTASSVLAATNINASNAGDSSIRAIAISVGIGGTAGGAPSVAVVNMASSAIARMDGVHGSTAILTVKAENVYPQVLAITGAFGAGGTAGVSASVAVVTFNSDTYAGIINSSELTAAKINVLTNVDNTAKAYAMGLAAGTVGVNGGLALVTNRSTTTTILDTGKYTVTGDVEVEADVDTDAYSCVIGIGAGAVSVTLNAAVVNQHAKVITQILGDVSGSHLTADNVTVSNDISAEATSNMAAVTGGGVAVGGSVLLVFNNMEATAAIINMPFNVTGNVTIQAGLKADSQASLVSTTVGGVAVGVSTSYVGLNAKNLAYLEFAWLPDGVTATAASIIVYAGSKDSQNSFNATATTVAGSVAGVNVGLNAAVADINVNNEAKIYAKGKLSGSVDVQADSLAAALAEVYFYSVGTFNANAATAVSLLRINQLAEAELSDMGTCGSFKVTSTLNKHGSDTTTIPVPSHAKLNTFSGGMYSGSANVAVAYSLSKSVARAILGKAAVTGNIQVEAGGAADAKSETSTDSFSAFNGSVSVNLAYANGQFQSLLRILDQVSANTVTVYTIYTTNANAILNPSAILPNVSLGSFNVNLAIARVAAKTQAALEGPGKLTLVNHLLMKTDSSNGRTDHVGSTAMADINGATCNISGFSFGANIADSQMALEQTVSVSHVTVAAGMTIQILGKANDLTTTAQTGANGGVGISIASGKVNSAKADVSAMNQIVLDNAKLNAAQNVDIRAHSDRLVVSAIAKALNVSISGFSAAVTTTEAKITKLNTGVVINNGNITGGIVKAAAYANGSNVIAQSNVPNFSGSLIGTQNILATAWILEKLTQVIVNAATIQATAQPAEGNLEEETPFGVILNAEANAVLNAGTPQSSISAGVVTVNDYQFTIQADEIRTEVSFDGQIDSAYDVILKAYDNITGTTTMDDNTIGGFTGTNSTAKIHVKRQTAHVKAAGMIYAVNNILIQAKADQALKANVSTSSKNGIDYGYIQTDIILYRDAIVDIDGSLTSQLGKIEIYAQVGTKDAANKVIDLNLDVYINTWIDASTYPTGTGKLVSTAVINVAEGSQIRALNVFDETPGSEAGLISIESRSEGNVLVDVYRFVDKVVGGNRAFSVADVSETVRTNIGDGAKTIIHGKNVNIRARTTMDVQSLCYAQGDTHISIYRPNAKVIFRVNLSTVIHSADISAKEILNISAYLLSTNVLGHCTSEKNSSDNVNSPSVTINGHLYGDVTFDRNTVLRAGELNVKAFHPNDTNPDNQVVIERKAECVKNGTEHSFDEKIRFDSNDDETQTSYSDAKEWKKFCEKYKLSTGSYHSDKNLIYYSGLLSWSGGNDAGVPNASGLTEIYLGSGASGTYVSIDKDGNVYIPGLSEEKTNELVYKQDGVYHVNGSNLHSTAATGTYSFKSSVERNSPKMDQSATSSDLTVLNSSTYTVQLDHVATGSKPGGSLNVTQTDARAGLIFNGGGYYPNGSIHIHIAGGDLTLMKGAQINARNIMIDGVGTILNQNREDGKVVVTNARQIFEINDTSIYISTKEALNLILQTGYARYLYQLNMMLSNSNFIYTIDKIQSGDDLFVEVVNITSAIMSYRHEMTVVLGELVSGGDIVLKVPYSLETADPDKINMTGNEIIVSAGGLVGTKTNYLCIDSSVNEIGGVSVLGSGGIYLKEASGDLYIHQIANVGSGNIVIWTQNGSIDTDPDGLGTNASDVLETLDTNLLQSARYSVISSEAEDMIKILLQYLTDLHRIRNALETKGETVLDIVKWEIDLLHSVSSVEEALEKIAQELINIGGKEYQNPETGNELMSGALKDEAFTEDFNMEAKRLASDEEIAGALEDEIFTEDFIMEAMRLASDEEIAGALGEQILIWMYYYQKSEESFALAVKALQNLLQNTAHIFGKGDLYLQVQSNTGTASVSKEYDSLTIAMDGKVSIKAAQGTVLKNVYLESYRDLKLDPIVATDVIDLYCINGIYAANNSDQVLLDACSVVLRAFFNLGESRGNLGTATQPLILNADMLDALGNFVYLENRKDLYVVLLTAIQDLYLNVKGDLMDLARDSDVGYGIHADSVTLQVTGDIGQQGHNVTIGSGRNLSIDARNLYMAADGDVLVGKIRTDGMVSISAPKGTIQNIDQNSAIWCNSLNLYAYGMIGSEESPLVINSNGVYVPNGGIVMRSLFRAAPVRATLMADSKLYGEFIKIVPIVDKKDEAKATVDAQADNKAPMTAVTVTDRASGIRVTGCISKDAVLVVSDVSEHVACPVCDVLVLNNQINGRSFMHLKLIGEYNGKLKIQIPATGELAVFEGKEILILTCRNGVVWAIRGTVINGYVTFFTEKLGPFLIFGDPALLDLTEDGTQIILNQRQYPFGGWL